MSRNQLVQRYATFQSPSTIQRNALLRSSAVKSHQQEITQKVRERQQMASIRRITQQNEKTQSFREDIVRERIIRPVQIIKDGKTNKDVKALEAKQARINAEIDRIAKDKKKPIIPYKNIIKDDAKLYQKKEIKQDDLVVCKVSQEDKDKKKIEAKIENLTSARKINDDENKKIYSEDKQKTHKKEFDYKQKYIYCSKQDSSQHDDIKKNRLEYFKDMQKQVEKDKKRYDDILESILAPEELKALDNPDDTDKTEEAVATHTPTTAKRVIEDEVD